MGKTLQLLSEEGLVYNGDHFVYTSGRHGGAYVNLRPLFPQPGVTHQLALDLVAQLPPDLEFDVVIGPDFGGNELAGAVAFVLAASGRLDVKLVRTRKRGKGFMVHPCRHYEKHLPGCRALVVEDVCTTDKTTKSVIRLIRRHSGQAVAVATVVDRSGLDGAAFGVGHFVYLERVPMKDYAEEECPFCHRGIPVNVNVGHGAEFMAKYPEYPRGFLVTLLE